jgi:hypothetical protein
MVFGPHLEVHACAPGSAAREASQEGHVNMRDSQNRFSRPFTIACDRRTITFRSPHTREPTASRVTVSSPKGSTPSRILRLSLSIHGPRRYRGRAQFSPGDTAELNSNASC